MRTWNTLGVTAVIAAAALVLAACGGGGGDAGGGENRPKVRLALDWTPNVNHTGIFIAQQQGWFEEAGLDVELLPYNNTSPDTLVSSGAADFGISFQDSFSFSKASGADITSVMAIVQHWATAIAVRGDRTDITTPADLDGKVYGGFGAAYEVPKMREVIKNAGGKGEFESIVLGTAAYEAVYAGEADFTEPFLNVEGVQAELRGTPFKTFSYTDYGFPDSYNVLLVGKTPWLADNRDTAAKFVQAVQRGYRFAAEDPARGAELLAEADPAAFGEREMISRGVKMMADEYLLDAKGVVGTQTPEIWAGLSGFLFDSGVLAGPDGSPLTERPDFSTWFTNDYLAPSP
ncbi:MAG: ABC transporter substrate-binding protein [Saccharothrix sp.]|nr:ABC transporter substrate-binding protein [Saccharothrix sp.]